jgi:sulfotransferase family protein
VNHDSPHRFEVQRSFRVRLINSGGRFVGPLAAPGLEVESLLRAASRKAGLDDFGAPAFREPLRRLIESVEAEAGLNTMGRLATRYDMIHLLVNRLRLVEDRKRYPGIEEEDIRRPIIITGLPRTGTTFLHALLALDPQSRVPLTWETMNPSPPPEAASYHTDPRIDLADRQIRWFHHMVNGFNRIHPIDARLPEECLIIFSQSFLSFQFETTHRVPSYLKWLEGQSLLPAYKVHRAFLQHLQWRCPGERWVLKAPAHMFDFSAMFSVYPDARVIMTHRDPTEVTASNASLTATLRGAFTDDIDPLEVGPECSRRWAGAIERAFRARDRGCAPAEQFLDIRYLDLIADPVGSVRKVYGHFGMPFPQGLEERILEFLRRSPRDRFGKHRYTPEMFGLTLQGEQRRFAAYRKRFHR